MLLQEAAEGAAPHIVSHIESVRNEARTSIFNSIATGLEKVLKQVDWPKASATIPTGLRQQWAEHVDRLLAFQQPELLKSVQDNAVKASKAEPLVLAPLEVLVRPLALRFQYHFSGDRMTNRLDKPEYFLNHVFDLFNEHAGFVNDNLQKLLLKHYGKTDLAVVPAYIEATTAWISALMPLLRKKLQSVLPQVATQPKLLSNLVHEVMAFDAKLQEEWNYTPLSTATPFRGLSHHVLSDLGYFAAWYAIEQDFALARYEAIISDRSTGNLDYESVDAHTTKPSKGAIRVNDLLETITDRYRPLTAFHQKMKFLIDIQIAIFDRFHSRLSDGLEAYLTRSSAVARTVHGVSQGDASELSGTKGLDRLCRVFGSAEYLEKAMQDWSEDVFFLDLWDDLQSRSQSQGQLKGDLSMQDISARTSAAAGNHSEELVGALFDETAASYHRLRTRSEQVMVDMIVYDLRASLRAYSRVNTWAAMSGTGAKPSLTAELDASVRLLDDYFAFLSKAIGKTSMRRIVGPILQSLQSYIWDFVLLRHTFSTAGAAQLRSDVEGLAQVIRRHTGIKSGSSTMRKLTEGLTLLSLPVKGEGAEDEEGRTPTSAMEPKKLGLWEVERRAFSSNEGAREVLEELGLEMLSENEAREVLKRRIEIAS